MLDRLCNSKNKVVGIKQTRKAIKEGRAQLVYLADNVDQHLFEDIQRLCKENKVELFRVNTMKELGEACGIDIKAAVAAMLDE